MWVPSLFLCSFSVFPRKEEAGGGGGGEMVQSASATFFPWPSRSIRRSPGERRKGRRRKCSPPPMHCFLLDPQYANGIAGSFPLGIILGKCRHSRRFTGFFFFGYLEALAAHVAFTVSSRGLSSSPFPTTRDLGLGRGSGVGVLSASLLPPPT